MNDMWERHSKGEAGWSDMSDMLADLHSRLLRTEGRGADADAFDDARKTYTDSRKASEGKNAEI